jgi:hypothetical protein
LPSLRKGVTEKERTESRFSAGLVGISKCLDSRVKRGARQGRIIENIVVERDLLTEVKRWAAKFCATSRTSRVLVFASTYAMPPKPSDAKQKTLFGFFNKEKGKPTTAYYSPLHSKTRVYLRDLNFRPPPEVSHNVAAPKTKETPLAKEAPPTTHYHSASSPIEIDSEDEVPVVMRKVNPVPKPKSSSH